MPTDQKPHRFAWKDLGDFAAGRPNLGSTTDLLVYRLMQYTLRDVLTARFGEETTSDILVEAGKLAGMEFCSNALDITLGFNAFIADLQGKLSALKIGILRMERSDQEKMEFILTLDEDLDCSGLPVCDDTVCEYDEGFIAGVFEMYAGKEFTAKEIDCWATGGRTCRFAVRATGKEVV